MVRNILQSNLLNQAAGQGDARAQRRAARFRQQNRTLKQKRRTLAQKKKEKVKETRDEFGNVWKMRKAQIEAKFNEIFENL